MFSFHRQNEFDSTMLQHEIRDHSSRVSVLKNASAGGLTRSKTFLAIDTSSISSFSGSSTSSSCFTDRSASSCLALSCSGQYEVDGEEFSSVMRDVLKNNPTAQHQSLRRVLEPYLRQARLRREKEMPGSNGLRDSMNLPYPCLRKERRFLFNEHTFPLHDALARAMKVDSLANIADIKDKDLLLPLHIRSQRLEFQKVYDSFVTSFCIPFLHASAISHQVFNSTRNERIKYRYQAFPDIRISRPGNSVSGQMLCDLVRGFSPANLTFYIPLTSCDESNCLYTESHPGREDWHALNAKAAGLGYLFDGARCLHFCLPNTTQRCSVALVFRVALLLDNEYPDTFSTSGCYYDEAIVDARNNDVVVKENRRLLDPDYRNGYPFV